METDILSKFDRPACNFISDKDEVKNKMLVTSIYNFQASLSSCPMLNY